MTNAYDTGRFANVTGFEKVASAADAARIVEQMLTDLQEHPDEWENPTLERFLDALAGSLDAAPADQADAPPTWRTFTEILVKATGYE